MAFEVQLFLSKLHIRLFYLIAQNSGLLHPSHNAESLVKSCPVLIWHLFLPYRLISAPVGIDFFNGKLYNVNKVERLRGNKWLSESVYLGW